MELEQSFMRTTTYSLFMEKEVKKRMDFFYLSILLRRKRMELEQSFMRTTTYRLFMEREC